jgi:hypothetical protein
MNGKSFGEPINKPEPDLAADHDTNNPSASAQPYTGSVPVLAALIQQTPTGAPISAIAPLGETTAHDIPTGGTIPYGYPAGETIVREVPSSNEIPYDAPVDETVNQQVLAGSHIESLLPLLDRDESDHFHARWNTIQGQFLDQPRFAVQQADGLVTDVIEKISLLFNNELHTLENEWQDGKNVSTEDARKALQRYHSFFNRLVI